jgi:hypothetical protein
MDRTRPDDMSRDHGNSGASDQTRDQDKDRDRTGSENGYQKTKYEPTGARGHAKPPPVTSHSSSKPKPATNPDEENNGPSN